MVTYISFVDVEKSVRFVVLIFIKKTGRKSVLPEGEQFGALPLQFHVRLDILVNNKRFGGSVGLGQHVDRGTSQGVSRRR